MNVNGTGAKAIYTQGVRYAYWRANSTVLFTYDGSYWRVASEPVYANTVTVGNAASRNIYIDSATVNVRRGATQDLIMGFGDGSAFIQAPAGLYIGVTKQPGESGASSVPHITVSRNGVFTQGGEIAVKEDLVPIRNSISYDGEEVATEKTWFGSTIYKKTINVGAIKSANKVVKHGISNVNVIWVDESASFLMNGNTTYPFPRPSNYDNQTVGWIADRTNFTVEAGSNANFSACYVTLLYTKTS